MKQIQSTEDDSFENTGGREYSALGLPFGSMSILFAPHTDSQHRLQFILPSVAQSNHEIGGGKKKKTTCSFPRPLGRMIKNFYT